VGASEFLVLPEILIYAGKCDPSDPDDPAADIYPLFQLVTLVLPGITGFLAGVFDDPAWKFSDPVVARQALGLSCHDGSWFKAQTSRRRDRAEHKLGPDTKHIFVDRR